MIIIVQWYTSGLLASSLVSICLASGNTLDQKYLITRINSHNLHDLTNTVHPFAMICVQPQYTAGHIVHYCDISLWLSYVHGNQYSHDPIFYNLLMKITTLIKSRVVTRCHGVHQNYDIMIPTCLYTYMLSCWIRSFRSQPRPHSGCKFSIPERADQAPAGQGARQKVRPIKCHQRTGINLTRALSTGDKAESAPAICSFKVPRVCQTGSSNMYPAGSIPADRDLYQVHKIIIQLCK